MNRPALRPYRPHDHAAVVDLFARVAADNDGTYPRGPRSQISRWVDAKTWHGRWVAATDSGLHGHIGVACPIGDTSLPVWVDALGCDPESLGVICRLGVSPAQRRTGLGRRLVDLAVAAVLTEGRVPVLDVSSLNTAAVGLYRAVGFAVIAEFPHLGPGGVDQLTAMALTSPGSVRGDG